MRTLTIAGLVALGLTLWPVSPAAAGDTYLSGFLQTLYGGGLDDRNPTASEMTASEARLQLRLESYSEAAEFFGRLDFVYDDYDQSSLDWELREGFLKFTVAGKIDVKLGRQIITWGTGDLVFVNDLFAKDYRSFFSGRDDQYLKAPHNALRVEYYSPVGAFTGVYSPRFTANRVPTGERLSYFSPLAGEIVGGEGYLFESRLPEPKFSSGEIAARYSRYIGSADLALYFYHGFYKDPVGFDMLTMEAYHPELNVYGASVRTPLLGGIAWLEAGYYDSRADTDGTDPTVPNSAANGLIGFERQITPDLTANLQYQNRTMLDRDNYIATLPPGSLELDEVYHLATTRLTQQLFMQTFTVSGFAFYSPSDEDFYGRFAINYKYTDALTLTAGANIFGGEHEHTNFGSFQRNDNAYVKVTYGY